MREAAPNSGRASGGGLERLLTLCWSGIENSCRQILSLVFFFVTVRFLQPRDLGVFALAVALNGIMGIVIDEPIGESLVQKASITREDWDTGFTVNLIMSVGVLLITAMIGWPLAHLLGEPDLALAMPALAFGAVIGSLGNIHRAYLARALRFRLLAQTAVASQVIGGLASVALAFFGFGYWALVANVAISAAVFTAICWRSSAWRPRPRISRATIRSRLPYAAYSAAIRTIYLLRDQSPVVVAMWLVDVTYVGYFSLALRVARTLGQLFEEVTNRPLISLVSREQHDMIRFGKVLTEILTAVLLVALPSYAGLAIMGPVLLPIVFGARWAPAGLFVPWICIVLLGWLVLHIVVVSLRARDLGRTAVLLTAPAALLDMLVLVALAPLGLTNALIGWAVRNLLSIPAAVWVLRAKLGVSPVGLGRRCGPSLIATATMVGFLEYANRRHMFGDSIAAIILTTAIAGALYTIVIGAFAAITVGVPNMKRHVISLIKVG